MDIVAPKGGIVQYNDPHIQQVHSNSGSAYASIKLTAKTLAEADVVVFTTNLSAFDVDTIQQQAKLTVNL